MRKLSNDARLGIGCLSVIALAAIVCSGLSLGLGPEHFASVTLADGCIAHLYAEGPLHYEPPGYLSVAVVDDERTVVPRYPFVGIGGERVPHDPYTAISTNDRSTVALKQGNDIAFMLHRPSGKFWPPANWTYYDFSPTLAQEMLDDLLVDNPGLTCQRLLRMTERVNQIKSRAGG